MKEKNIILVSPSVWANYAPNYSIAVLGGLLKKNNIDYKIFDLDIKLYNWCNKEEKELWESSKGDFWNRKIEVEKLLKKYIKQIEIEINKLYRKNKINFFCFTVTEKSIFSADYIVKLLKKKERTYIVYGGQYCWGTRAEQRMKNKDIDAVCFAEAENCFIEFLRFYPEQKREYKGFIIRQEQNLKKGIFPALPEKTDFVYADYSKFNLKEYTQQNIIPIMTSRGCVNKCKFCVESPGFMKYRYRNAEDVFKEMLFQLKSLKLKYPIRFMLNDSLINGNFSVFEKLIKLLKEFNKHEQKIIFTGMALVRKEMKEEFMLSLKQAGCIELIYGIESGSDRVLKLMGKSFNSELAAQVIKNTNKAGIKCVVNIVTGFPGETEKDFYLTLDWVRKNAFYIDCFGLATLQIFPDSYIYNNYKEYKIETPDEQHSWKTIDNDNNIYIRNKRAEIIRYFLGPKYHDLGWFADDDKLYNPFKQYIKLETEYCQLKHKHQKIYNSKGIKFINKIVRKLKIKR